MVIYKHTFQTLLSGESTRQRVLAVSCLCLGEIIVMGTDHLVNDFRLPVDICSPYFIHSVENCGMPRMFWLVHHPY